MKEKDNPAKNQADIEPIVEDKPAEGLFLTKENIKSLSSVKGVERLFKSKNLSADKIVSRLEYEKELQALQIELVKLQNWVIDSDSRVAIIFEGRDASGKGGTIKRFTQHLSPRGMRVVALPKPTSVEQGQWYFQRYVNQLPNPGEIVFFDRSWYNRAVVEPVNGFCDESEYQKFMLQVPAFEHMLYEDKMIVIKFWFSISKDEQKKRFRKRRDNPLKQWKQSPVDARAQDLWDQYTYYKNEMFSKTHTAFSPWLIIRANNKKLARLESIRYVLSKVPYDGKKKASTSLHPDPNIVMRFHREVEKMG